MEKLIELVKNYVFLYDTENEDYKNVNKKNDTWELIAMEVGIKDGK